MAKNSNTKAKDRNSPSPNRGEEVLAAWRAAGGTGDTAACVADILALVVVEAGVSHGEALADGDEWHICDTPESVCEEAMSAVEVWIADERKGLDRE
jgi:hypothetical protein